MAYKRKTWHEKLHTSQQSSVKQVENSFADIPAGATMLIATPAIVDAYIRNIPEGTHTSIQQMRKDLAAEYVAAYMCPVTAGIFLRIVAEAAWEDLHAGKAIEDIAPFWRMLDHHSPTCRKLSFGTDFIKEQRKREGLPF